MMNRHQHLIQTAQRCSEHPNGQRPFGAYVTARYFSGGFAFHSASDALAWTDRLCASATKNGESQDFHAAVAAADGSIVGAYGYACPHDAHVWARAFGSDK